MVKSIAEKLRCLGAWDNEEIQVAARAMRNSKAWPVVFAAGAAVTLATAASNAVEEHRAKKGGAGDSIRTRRRGGPPRRSEDV